MHRLLWFWVAVLAMVMAAGVWRFRSGVAPPIAKSIAMQSATMPAITPVRVALKITSYIDLVRAYDPVIPATQPLELPVDLADAAHIHLRDPVYLDPLGHLWITRADAPSTQQSLRNPLEPTEHLIADRPVFVHWSVDDNGDWSAFVITRRRGNRSGYDIISALDRKQLVSDRLYRWESAFSWDGKIVVPTDQGVSVIEVEPNVRETFHALAGMKTDCNPPIAILDSRGVLAWAPWENGREGSRGAARFVDGKWMDLTGPDWPEKIVQLIPLLDGSILQIIAGEGDAVNLSIAPLESGEIEARHVADLVDQLSDDDPEKRQAAFDELSRYGPGLWPILEKITDQPAEARVRIQQLLRAKIAPALNGMRLMDNRLAVLNRQTDGTVLLFAPIGVEIFNGQQESQKVSPAWLAVHPDGRVDRPLPKALINDQSPDTPHLYFAHDDWLVCDDAGVRRFFGNTLVPLLQPQEREFSRVLGVDRRGRWMFRQPGGSSEDTLVIDPTILDPTPRLPVWTMTIEKGSVGWTPDNYPAIQRGGAWALKADGWEAIPDHTKMLTESSVAPPPPTTEPTGTPLLVGADGTRYFDGRDALLAVDKAGKEIRWPLPASAVGSGAATLLCDPAGLLFLFNQPGRVLRIKPTPAASEPFEIQATFTRDIPSTEHPTRIWLDPLGRMDLVYDGNVLAVMFPSGHIPPEIARMMLDEPR